MNSYLRHSHWINLRWQSCCVLSEPAKLDLQRCDQEHQLCWELQLSLLPSPVGGWVSGWVGEWVGGWVSEWVSELVSEWASVWVSMWMSEWVCVWASERMNGWVSEWVSRWVSGWVNEWVGECVSEWVSECEWVSWWVSELCKHEDVSEWVSGWVCMCVCVCVSEQWDKWDRQWLRSVSSWPCQVLSSPPIGIVYLRINKFAHSLTH